jgi:hypothetical protein
LSNRFTSKNPSTPQGKRGRLRKKERKIAQLVWRWAMGWAIGVLRFENRETVRNVNKKYENKKG